MKRMTVRAARSVLNTIHGGVLPPGALWISGLLDEASQAERVLKRAAKRNAAERKKRKAKREQPRQQQAR